MEIAHALAYFYEMKKSTVYKILETLPEEFEAGDLIEKISIVEKIEEGLADIAAGKVISHGKVKSEVKLWGKIL